MTAYQYGLDGGVLVTDNICRPRRISYSGVNIFYIVHLNRVSDSTVMQSRPTSMKWT